MDTPDAVLEERLQQQQVIADFGQLAMETDDPARLNHEACAAVTETLDTELCEVLELLPGGDEVVLSEGIGWQEGLVGSAQVPVDPDTQAGHALLTQGPVVVEDLPREGRFSGPAILHDHDVVSCISVIIGSVDDPLGVLGTHATRHRDFTEHDVAFIQSIANVLASAFERADRESALERSLNLLRHTERVADVGSWEIEVATDEVHWSDQLFEILGVEADEQPDLDTALALYHPDDRQRVAHAIEAAIDRGEWIDVESRVETPDGEVRWLHVIGEPVTSAGEVAWVRGAAQDITERKERERELERTLDLLTKTERLGDVAGWEVDTDTMEPYWSDHLFDIVDVEYGDQPTLEQALDVYHTHEDRERVENAVETALETGEPFDLEVRFPRPTGDVGWLHVVGAPDIVDGGVVRVRGVVQDVTERKHRERELERFKRAVEASGHAIYMTDAEGVITYVNPAFEETTGYTASEAVGQRPGILRSDEQGDEYYRTLWESIGAGEVWEEEITDRRKDGTEYHAIQTIAPVTDADDEIDRFVAVQHDITERKEHQQALARSERRYRALVDHFPNGAAALYDQDLRFTAAGGELFEESAPDDPMGQLFGGDRRDVIDDIEPHLKAAFDGEEREFELAYGDRHVLARTLPIRRTPGDGYAAMLVVLDVTEQREYERRLQASHQRLEEFASAVSHDLREPLRTVANYLQLLEGRYEEDLEDDAREFIEFAVGGAERMREMIDGLVTTYAEVDPEGEALSPVDLHAVLEDVLVDLEGKIEATDAKVTEDQLPTVAGDRGQLRQLVMNLVDNAIKYAGDEPPRIHVSAERTAADTWTVAVRDEGIGIDADPADRVFDVFSRLHREDEYPGTGIGLALCERIVERHGGDIWVESEPGVGSTFYFTLPAAEGDR